MKITGEKLKIIIPFFLISCLVIIMVGVVKKHEVVVDNIIINEIKVSNSVIYLLAGDKPIVNIGYPYNPKEYSYKCEVIQDAAFITVCTSDISLENNNNKEVRLDLNSNESKEGIELNIDNRPFSSNFNESIRGNFKDVKRIYLKDKERKKIIWIESL